MPKLILKERGSDAEKTFDFKHEDITIGRSETSSIAINSTGVSRSHARIYPDAKDFYIKDLGSGNGTKLNGIRLPKNEKYILKHNDVITIDNFDLRFQLIDELLNQSFNDITDSDILEVKLLKKVLRALDRETIPSIEVLNGVAEGKKGFLSDDIAELTIGRDPMCEFQIEEYVISRKHARIVKKWGGIIIEDLGSKNGVYVNNRQVKEEFLHDGDRIALGTIVLMFRNPKEVNIDEIGRNMEKEKKKTAPPPAPPPPPKEKVEEKPKEKEDEEVSSTSGTLSEEQQKELVKKVKKQEYPTPVTTRQRQKIKFSFIELCFLGLGALVFLFGIIMLVNLVL